MFGDVLVVQPSATVTAALLGHVVHAMWDVCLDLDLKARGLA